jgi:hypothetical protein
MIVEDAHFPYDKIRIVVGPSQAKRLAEAARPTAQSPVWAFGIASVRPHCFNPG